ncbi:MAG TPA: SMC family ATPase [Gemmatimonadales bacterium]
MRLHRMRLLNFRQHVDTEIDFGAGLTAIIGPNGAGKSTLLEAIGWALYGNVAARGTRDSIRYSRAPARTAVRVEVDFALGPHDFRVARTLSSAELYQDRHAQPIANSHQEVSARVEHLLGMSREEFFSTYFTGQKELAVMAAMKPVERGRFLSRVLGYEQLREAQDRVRQRRREISAELQGLEKGLADPGELEAERVRAAERVTEAETALREARDRHVAAAQELEYEGPRWTQAVQQRERALSLDGERRVAERDVGEARRAFERIDRDLAEALAARTEYESLAPDLARVEPLRVELERLEREAKNAGRRRALMGQLSEVRGQEEQLRERLARLGNCDAALEGAIASREAARTALKAAERLRDDAHTAWVRDRQDAQTQHLTLRDQYRDHREHRHTLVEAGEDGECPICKRPLGQVFGEVLDTLDRQMEEIEVRGKYFKRRLDQLESIPSEVVEAEQAVTDATAGVEEAVREVARREDRIRERDALQADLERAAARAVDLGTEVERLPEAYDSERHDVARAELRALEPLRHRAAALEGQAARAEGLVAEAEAAERTLSERETRYQELQRVLADLGFDEVRYEAVRVAYELAARAAREAELTVASTAADAKAAGERLASAEQRLKERAAKAGRVRELGAAVRLHEELDRALGDLRSALNSAMRPELAERASAFLDALTDGRYPEIELDEQYNVLVVEDGRGKPVISGGEEDLANLALRLGISQMVADRAGQPLSLLVLDEIFGSLDERRQQSVIELLRALADRFPQVVLITHIEAVREGVDRVIRITLDESRGAAVVLDEQGIGDVAA